MIEQVLLRGVWYRIPASWTQFAAEGYTWRRNARGVWVGR